MSEFIKGIQEIFEKMNSSIPLTEEQTLKISSNHMNIYHMNIYIVINHFFESYEIKYVGDNEKIAHEFLNDGERTQDNILQIWSDGHMIKCIQGTYKK